MRRLIKVNIIFVALLMLMGCGKDNAVSQGSASAIENEQAAIIENIPITDPAYWTTRGSDLTGYVQVPYNWTEDEYEYELEEHYSLMLISPERNAMVSLVKNNYGFDPNMYDSQPPGEVILESYISQYESQGGQNLEVANVLIGEYDFYRSVDCYPAGVYADYDYYIYTYVTYTGDRFYTMMIEGELEAIEPIVAKVEESFSAMGNQ